MRGLNSIQKANKGDMNPDFSNNMISYLNYLLIILATNLKIKNKATYITKVSKYLK